MKGYTFSQYLEGGRALSRSIAIDEIPEGTSKSEYMIVGDIAVYTPYIPLMQTPEILKQ